MRCLQIRTRYIIHILELIEVSMEKLVDTVNCCQHIEDLKLQYTQFSW